MDEGTTGKTRRRYIAEDAPCVLRVSLEGYRPEIWRRVVVPRNLTLGGLHWVIQFAMGWTNSHLHQFEIAGGVVVSDPSFELETEDLEDEDAWTVGDAFPRRRARIVYEYDFGDSWTHVVQFEDYAELAAGAPAIFCLDGARACPPEDSGGVWGYADLLEALDDPEHEEHEAYAEWVPEGFDRDAFDPRKTNRQLKRLRLVPRTTQSVIPPPEYRVDY